MTPIAIVVPYAFPETGASSARSYSFALALTQHGYHPIIFAPEKNIPQSTEFSNVSIIRFKKKKDLLELFRKHRIKLIIASTPPADLGLIALAAGAALRIPVIADIRDPWVFDKEAVGLINSKSMKFFIQKKMEELFYRAADERIVVSDWTRKLFEEKLGITSKSFRLIPNGVQASFFTTKKESRTTIRKKLGIPSKSVLFLYQGAVWRDIPTLIHHLAPILQKKNAHMLILGNTDLAASQKFVDNIEEALKETPAKKRIHYLFNVKPTDMPSYLEVSDIGLNTLADTLYYSIPVKTYEYAFSGMPILTKGPEKGALKDFYHELKSGYYCVTWEEFEKKAKALVDDLSSQKKKAKTDAGMVEKKYSREILAEELIKLIRTLIKSK